MADNVDDPSPDEAKKKKTSKGKAAVEKDASKDPDASEARRIKSRDAARSRRDQENHEIFKLSQLLPLPVEIVDNLDKSSILRLALAFIRLKSFLGDGAASLLGGCNNHSDDDEFAQPPPLQSRADRGKEQTRERDSSSEDEADEDSLPKNPANVFSQSACLLSALKGFLMIVASDGFVMYASSNIRQMLGIREVEIIGQHIRDFVQQEDHHILCRQLKRLRDEAANLANGMEGDIRPARAADADLVFEKMVDDSAPAEECCFSLNMKAFNERKSSSRGASSHASVIASTKGMSYELVRFQGSYAAPKINRMLTLDTSLGHHCMVLICRPIEMVHSQTQVLGTMAFQTRHSLDLSFLECCKRMKEFTEYDEDIIKGKPLYDFIHPEDAKKLRNKHSALLNGSQSVHVYVRYMLPSNENLLVLMIASIYKSPKTGRAMCINAINYVVSQDKEEGQWHIYANQEAQKECERKALAACRSLVSAQVSSEQQTPALQSGSLQAPALPLVQDGNTMALQDTASAPAARTLLQEEWLDTRGNFHEMIAQDPSRAGDVVVKRYLSKQAQSTAVDIGLEEKQTSSEVTEEPSPKRARLSSVPSLATGLSVATGATAQSATDTSSGEHQPTASSLSSTAAASSDTYSSIVGKEPLDRLGMPLLASSGGAPYDPGFMEGPSQPNLTSSADDLRAYNQVAHFLQGTGDLGALHYGFGQESLLSLNSPNPQARSLTSLAGAGSSALSPNPFALSQQANLPSLVRASQSPPQLRRVSTSGQFMAAPEATGHRSAAGSSSYWSQQVQQAGNSPQSLSSFASDIPSLSSSDLLPDSRSLFQ